MTWLDHWLLHADVFAWTSRLVHIAALGQTLFVLLWATRPWYRLWIGRALMVKSFSLMLYLLWAVAVLHGWVPLDQEQVIALSLFGFITLGIWSQLAALLYEMSAGSQQRHPFRRRR